MKQLHALIASNVNVCK